MKKIFSILLICTAQFVLAQEAAVKKATETFFQGLNTVNTEKIKTVAAESFILQSVEVHTQGNKFTQETAQEFYASLTKVAEKVKFEEKVSEYKVQTDGHIANVWAPYEFYINGKLSHKGVNSIQLVKFNEGWKIVYIIDTRMP